REIGDAAGRPGGEELEEAEAGLGERHRRAGGGSTGKEGHWTVETCRQQLRRRSRADEELRPGTGGLGELLGREDGSGSDITAGHLAGDRADAVERSGRAERDLDGSKAAGDEGARQRHRLVK